MLNRVLSKHPRLITLISSSSSSSRSQSPYQYIHHQNHSTTTTTTATTYFCRYFSSTNGGNGKDIWKIISSENEKQEEEEEEEDTIESIFGDTSLDVDDTLIPTQPKQTTAEWTFKNDDTPVFDHIVSDINAHTTTATSTNIDEEKDKLLEIEEKALSQLLLKDSDHAFGDLIAASGITDDMLHSLMALKDFDDVPGLPPLRAIEDMRYEKNTRKSTRGDIERQKQDEIAASRVRQVDSLGRAYGTGKRKCSIARVWIEPGEGKFVVNDKQFDVYFPMLDQRAALLRPLSETKTLGLLDVSCTVKGGGMSGQIGAIRLGMSRALQNWAPDQFRPPLKEAGFLTRDSRIVERKKPGKAKARKSFQWVKR